MKLRITGRHMNVTPALREYVETRFERLDRYGLKVGSLQVVLDVEKLQHKAEVVGVVSGKPVQAKTATREMYATIDALVDRVDAQFRKWKERLVNHKPSKMKKVRAVPLSSAKPSVQEPAEAERQAVPILSIAQAQKQFMAGASSYMLFVNVENKRVQVVHRLTSGDLAVIEPYAEDSRLRSSIR
jgi:putative sigma-54 modulation protein